MSFLKRPWTDGEKWAMGIAAAVIVAAVIAWMKESAQGDVTLQIASKRDHYGRCVDKELLLKNLSKMDAIDVRITFDVDYFTKRGDVKAQYGTAEAMLISPVEPTLLKRTTSASVNVVMGVDVLTVARLQPGESVHVLFGGESYMDSNGSQARRALLDAGNPNLMDKPKVISTARKDGAILVKRVVSCAPAVSKGSS